MINPVNDAYSYDKRSSSDPSEGDGTSSLGGSIGSSNQPESPTPRKNIARENTQILAPAQSLWTQISNRIMVIWRSIFSPHPLHDEKYQIALDTQRRALEEFRGAASRLSNLLRTTGEEQSYYRSIFLAIRVLNSECADVRLQYQMYHKYLRDAIESKPYKYDTTIAKEILFCLCKAKFESNIMLDYHKKFQQTAVGSKTTISDLDGFVESLSTTNRSLKNSSKGVGKSWVSQTKQKLEGCEWLPGADNIGRSNIPEVRSYHTYSDGRTVTSLRHGTVIISPEGRNRKMAPEYMCYLHAKKEPVLYMNHQRADSSQTSWIDKAEVDRSDLLHQVESEFENLHCLSLPMDGLMFDGNKSTVVSELKDEVRKNICGQKLGFKLPKCFVRNAKTLKINDIFDFVHTQFFSSQAELTKVEKKLFMMIFYFYLKERIKYKLYIDSVVTVCKDNKDRGNASGTIDELLLGFHTGKHTDPAFLTDLHDRFFGAYMIKYEEIIEKRIDLVKGVAKILASCNRDAIQKGYGDLIANDSEFSPSVVTIAS